LRQLLAVATFGLVVLAGCSSDNNKPATKAAPPAATVVTVAATRTAATAKATSPASATPAVGASAPSGAATQSVQTADSAPCLSGQIKGDSSSKIYHSPGNRDYARTKSNVVCFDTPAQAQAAG